MQSWSGNPTGRALLTVHAGTGYDAPGVPTLRSGTIVRRPTPAYAMPAPTINPIPAVVTQARPPGSGALTLLFFLTLAALAVALYAARAQFPGPTSGEFWSDANVINGCRGYDQVGFTATWGLPRIQLAAPPDDTKALYLSYPPGPYWFSYAAWSAGQAIGLDPILSARLFAQTCGLASGLLLFLVCSRLARSQAIGALAGLFYILSPAFLSYSAALHHMAYSPMLLLGAMRAWLAFEDGLAPRRWAWLALTALLFAADCWTNLEHMFFFALFVGVRAAFHFRWPVVLGAALVGPLPVPMMALRVLHNAQVLGGWDAALAKFRSRASSRSSGGRAGVDLPELLLSWLARLDWPVAGRTPGSVAWNQEFVYPALNPWVVAGVGILLLTLILHRRVRRRPPERLPLSLIDPAFVTLPPLAGTASAKPARLLFWDLPPASPIARGLAGGLLLLAGGLTWFLVMTQHTQPHRFIVLLLMPGLALLLGTLSGWVIDSARTCTRGLTGPLPVWIRLRAWTVSALFLAVFAAQARRADVLNQLAPLDPATRHRVKSRVESNARVVNLGDALQHSGVARVYMYDGANMMPWRAASIALPFLYARIEMPHALDPADAVYAEAWDKSEIDACLDAIDRFGLPDVAGTIEDRTLIFRSPTGRSGLEANLDVRLVAASPPAGTAREPAAHDANPAPLPPHPPAAAPTLRTIRWSPTMVSDHMALLLLVSGDLGQNGGAGHLDRFTFSLRVRTPQGLVVHESRTRLRPVPIRDEGRALVVLLVPSSVMTPDTTADLAIWDRQARAPVLFRAPHLPPFAPDQSGRRLTWPTHPSPPP